MDKGIPTSREAASFRAEATRSIFRESETRVFGFLHLRPPQTRLARAAFWLLSASLLLGICAWVPGGLGTLSYVLCLLTIIALIIVCCPLLLRWIYRRLLWKVRDRLIVTYLLMGLAPIVLFVTLAGISAYIFSGQFAIFAATSVINTELAHVDSENRAFALHVSHELDMNPGARAVTLPEFAEEPADHPHTGLQVVAFRDGHPVAITGATTNGAPDVATNSSADASSNGSSPAVVTMPSWLTDDVNGLVLDNGELYFRSVDTHISSTHTAVTETHRTTVISSLPVSRESLDHVAAGLGHVTIVPAFKFEGDPSGDGHPGTTPRVSVTTNENVKPGDGVNITVNRKGIAVKPTKDAVADMESRRISGGRLPRSKHFYDVLVSFLAPLSTTDWATGKTGMVRIEVSSRPSLLYRRLFITSLEIAGFIQWTLLAIAACFAILELIAFIIAMRLNRTITQSIRDLYNSTREIDRGNFDHRIVVKRNDQLAALSGSFNGMTASLGRLIQEQREKERLQSELAIAQEVQANLFPRSDISLPSLELHGVCRPARTVSGDYYDFLLFGDHGLGLALGDISGKGISAALLMASLHSAVRAYRFAGQGLVYQGTRTLASAASLDRRTDAEEIDRGEWFESPATVLALLNRHLYRSTQPEKYATLFLAHYDARVSRLTYSNGGQLPPFVLRRNNSITRLDCGGTVVGLIDNMSYEQETVTLNRGDILIAYSDGVTEPENEFGDFGEDRLIDIVRRNRDLPLPLISEQVMQALQNWIGAAEQPDDITLVLARQV